MWHFTPRGKDAIGAGAGLMSRQVFLSRQDNPIGL
jgi:hypothetical protein